MGSKFLNFNRLYFALFSVAVATVNTLPLSAANNLELKKQDRIEASTYLSELRKNVTLAEARASTQWRQLYAIPSHGFTNEVIWLKLKVIAQEEQDYVLLIDRLLLTTLEVFLISDHEIQKMDLGYDAIASGKTIPHRRPIAQLRIHKGTSEIYFRVRSEGSFVFPLTIYSPAAFQIYSERELVFYGSVFAVLLIMALYNFFIYLSTRERSYRSYVFHALTALAFYFCMASFALEFMQFLGRHWLSRSIPVFAGLVGFTGVFFARSFLRTKEAAPRLDRLLMASGVVSLLTGLISLLPWVELTLMRGFLGGLGVFNSLLGLTAGLYLWGRGFAPARFFVLAFFAWFMGVLVLAVSGVGISPSVFLVKYSMPIGSLIEMILLSLALADRINQLKKSLEKNMRDLEASEKKYRALVEDTQDLIFSLGADFRFVSLNQAARSLLGYAPAALVGKSLHEMLYHPPSGTDGIQEKLVDNWFAELETGPVEFRMHILQKAGEPLELAFRLEKVQSGEETLIFGRASASLVDGLLQFLVTEKGSYAIENYLTTSELVHRRITRNLTRYFSQDDAESVAFCLREMLVNAIEHGNLEIDYDAKTRAQADGTYLQLITERQRLARYRDRKVQVEFSLNAARLWFRISDQGQGFDHQTMQANEKERMTSLRESHGRGIALTRSLFDIVRYNAKGNQVTLVKHAVSASTEL